MKDKAGFMIGFAIGVAGFLYLFKIIILNHVPPVDELAPGIVVLASLVSGVLFAFIGKYFQTKILR
jgi:hypothetical protein